MFCHTLFPSELCFWSLEEKILREHGVDENTIEKIRTDDRADFNFNRRFYHWTSDFNNSE